MMPLLYLGFSTWINACWWQWIQHEIFVGKEMKKYLVPHKKSLQTYIYEVQFEYMIVSSALHFFTVLVK